MQKYQVRAIAGTARRVHQLEHSEAYRETVRTDAPYNRPCNCQTA
ncbi:MAG TPA: hypothetical protein VK211_19590 [Kamptonema sp.]|nr:hypothetical protein [Kamptonema sp.]